MDYNNSCSNAKNGTFVTLQMLLSQEIDVLFGPICSTGMPLVAIIDLLLLSCGQEGLQGL